MIRRILVLTMAMVGLLMPDSVGFAATHAGAVTVEVDLSAQPQGREVRLWVPYPLSDEHQVISNVKVQGDYAEMGFYSDRIYGTPILYAEWPKDAAGSRRLTLSFDVVREEIKRPVFPASEPNWNPADYAFYLQPTSLGPIDGEVKKLADRITQGKQSVLEKAKAIYDWTVENMYRDPDTVGCGKGDVCALLQKPGGKCTDISSVYIALARAAGVPAREVFSVRLGKKDREDITGWQHCWAEFFLPGAGWITVDPADVRKAMLVEKLTLTDAKTQEYREFFWGGVDPYRVVVAKGRDLVLSPPQQGPPLNTFGYPYAEVDGQALDFYQPESFVYRITYLAR